MTNLLNYRRFHLVGIKGVAMSALALILRDMGKQVSGSDLAANFGTQAALNNTGITVYNQFAPRQIKEAEVVVYSAAHGGSKNPEVIEAVASKIPICSFPMLIGELSLLKPTVAVCGCHGKTTTSSIISHLALSAGLNPGYFVGVSNFMDHPGGAWGEGELFVTEADEYLTDPENDRKSKFLYFNPRYIVCTNLDFDHPDFFNNLSDVSTAYLAFFKKAPADGFLLVNGDDQALVELAKTSGKQTFTYGFKETNDYRLELINNGFRVFNLRKEVASLSPRLIGEHNYLNLGAAIAFFELLKIRSKEISLAANEFTGAARRLERRFTVGENQIMDDYAHHPTEIAASLKAVKIAFPEHHIALCFQPHTFSRTRALYKDFLKVLKLPDFLGLLPIFASAREPLDSTISSKDLLRDLNRERSSLLLDTDSRFSDLVKTTQSLYPKWVYLTMGAGDVYQKIDLIREAL